ncbi:hypothetical protein PFISCL1PPCAC_5940 [Pristionchus fissidentatus]|uniref:Protein root UVB sensitive/RUS domain-containing protein n=1 Tax=Pristionchus fissidentatus TaxID=1538716 RepID=A0AAV5V696_9BILA|nr:hypothetical protein PFISCL1PPCAC_5940 [Pristionchus fissidentatus]
MTGRSIIESYSRKPRLKYILDGKDVTKCVDVPSSSSSFSFHQLFISAFLPQGFPHSVTDDYLEYQMYDTLQALASSLTGALATEAVLTSAGVGNKDATALAATITWLLKDGCGMIGRIIFSYAKGTELDAESKKWRLVADLLNDIAFFIDLLSPLFSFLFLPLACLSSLLRCIVGVAGGATRTSIVQHQARRGNLADVAAKDGSQETLVNVFALLLSLVLLPTVSGKRTVIWCLFGLFTAVHLFANYRAVRSLRFDVFNRNRAAIVMRHYLSTGSILPISLANEREPLVKKLMGSPRFGCSRHDIDKSSRGTRVIEKDQFVVSLEEKKESIAMRSGSTPIDQLHAVFDLVAAKFKNQGKTKDQWEDFLSKVRSQGYNVDVNYLCFDEWEWEEN